MLHLCSLPASRRLTCRAPLCAALILALLDPAFILAQNTRGFEQAAAPTSASPGIYYALVIGIDDYPSLPHLATAVHDAQTVGAVLESSYGFKGHVTYLLNKDATRARIMDALEGANGYAQTLGESDNLLIYYAGHGYYNTRTDKAYWLPYDAESALSANHISADDLTTAIRGLASHHVLIVSDSCYSGDLTRGVDDTLAPSKGEQAFIGRMLAAPSRNILSSGGNEPVSDSGPGGHSIFAAALLRALDEVPGPLFTAGDIVDPVKKMVRAHSDQIPEYFRIGNSMPSNFQIDICDFVFNRTGASAPAGLPATPSDSPKPPVLATGAVGSPAADDIYKKGRALDDAKKYTEAAPLFADACNQGSAKSCSDLGFLYSTGSGVTKDLVKAATLYRKGCEAGNALSCKNLGLAYERGDGLDKDLAQASAFYAKACDGGPAAACSQAGYTYVQGNGVPKDPARAATFFKKACDGADPAGCNELGFLYVNGNGVGRDYVQANALFRKACDAGELHACGNLSYSYETGTGVDKDLAQAATLSRKGCDGGSLAACTHLGLFYQLGSGVDKDPAQAAILYRKACDGGDARGCTNLGFLYDSGTGIDKDPAQAASLYRKGCDGGNPVGCTDLGSDYENGHSLPQDKKLAVEYYRKACDGGNQLGCDGLKRLNP
jgi:TPR repeat protein